MSDQQQNDSRDSPILNKTKQVTNDSAIAMELPFTLVGAILVAGGLGYLLDHWLHTKPIFTLILGALGFAGGVREVIRRLPGK
jgi:F0F1-type ATP synthase assembly protein I